MVVDMLTSPQEQIPPRVPPTEEDGRNSATALSANRHSDHHPHAVPHASVFHRSDDPGSSSASRSLNMVRTNPSDGADSSEQQRMNSSERDSMESHEDRDESRHRQPEDKTARSCKRKLDLTSLSLGSHDATKARDSEKKDPESPPPAKRWVIGPLFQSFKSKMASFTEIVMSPVRLFKPNDLPAGSNNEAPSVTHVNKEDVGTDGKDVFSKKEEKKITPVTKLPVVQRLNFDTNSSDVGDSEQNKVTISQSGSEQQQDSIPEDDGSFGSLNSASTRRSTSQITEAVRASNVQQSSREEKQNCKSMNPNPPPRTGLVDSTDSVRRSLTKGSESGKAVQELIVLCEEKALDELTKHTEQADKSKSQDQEQPLPKKLRLPTPAIGKKKKGRGMERSELAEMVKRVEKEGTIGTDRVEKSPTVTQTKTFQSSRLVQTGKRMKVQVSDECLSTYNSGDVQMSDLNSCNSSEREKIGQMRASRSRSKREKDVKCTLVALDIMSATSGATRSALIDLISTNVTNDSTPAEGPPLSGSLTWASSRTTRQRKNNKVCEERKSDIAESCSIDPAECLKSSNGTSVSKLVRRNNIRQAKRKSETSATSAAKKPQVNKKSLNTRRVKRAMDAFEDQGMSMSLTLEVGSGVDGDKEATSIMSCGITTRGRKMGGDVMLADASCPSRVTPEDRFCVKDDRLTDMDGGYLEKKDKRRRRCMYSERRETDDELDQEDDSKPGQTSSGCGSNRLKRSLSCPDITSLQHGHDASSAPVSEKTLCHPSPLKKVPHFNVSVPSPFKRARRHTVCSVEIEREIAPLCLRKEVYPKWGSTSNYLYPRSPSKSLASLVSCFLSSPQAFLSKKSSRGHNDDSGYGASSSDLRNVSSSSSLSPPLLNSPASSSVMSGSAFFADAPHTPEQSSVSSHCSVYDAVSMEADEGVVQQDSEENEQSSAVSEEKALSDSEIKTDSKQMERRKVSSIRIRKTLPKPQYNLTPMGLPKAVRIKKKVFSVEEIYTNKNFFKPPEGRLETIFEVPLSRRDGSQSLIGPKRVKRFVEFPELGVVRKPRKPLIGGAGGGGAQRKAAGNSGMGRTRRGREEEALHLQDFDSLLCSKLNELDLWMVTEQMVY
ncbi:hypothetical protein PHYPO_G00040870 [Pangasianodon hypophthalmus]|uniref:Tantalus-like domain-containing protein n=1 Tax=Pangasianodon hypophthalmus TaxID=310915 RepID=A0A5N5MH27_PANHP|nr:hypothetical protein PHYPO_G00040870 [Pangasianodon hypophthalmus]